MNYENVNLQSGHETHHHVTRCLHTEDVRRDIAAGGKFSHTIAANKVQQPQEVSQTQEGLVADLRNISDQRRGWFFGGEGTIFTEAQRVTPSVFDVKDVTAHEPVSKIHAVRAEDAAMIAGFGLEEPVKTDIKLQSEGSSYRVHASSGNSFFRQKREEIKSWIGGNVRKGLKKIQAVFRGKEQKKETMQKSSVLLEREKEYLLDSYGKDGAYRQMPESGLLQSNMNAKA